MADDEPLPQFFEESETPPVSQKAQRRKARKASKAEKQSRRNPKPIAPRSHNQALYIESLRANELTFAVGPAGVGKTYVPARVYGGMLAAGEISKLYVARPNVSKAKHQNGFLPGSVEEKTAPWLVPIFEGVRAAMSRSEFERFRRDKLIEEVPYEFIQGRTFSDAACIIDEAENLDLDDLYITLTRQGDALSMVICGDIYQSRIPDSGLATVIDLAQSPWMEGVGVVEFSEEDVVRSRQARQWVKAFRGHWRQNNLHQERECGIRDDITFRDNLPSFLRGA